MQCAFLLQQLDSRLNLVKTYRFFLDRPEEYWKELINKWFMSDKFIVVRAEDRPDFLRASLGNGRLCCR